MTIESNKLAQNLAHHLRTGVVRQETAFNPETVCVYSWDGDVWMALLPDGSFEAAVSFDLIPSPANS